ncbi:hypothetical protein Droror1_Dr00001364 [Drosera rotundifolia]
MGCVGVNEKSVMAEKIKAVCKRKSDFGRVVTEGLVAVRFDASVCSLILNAITRTFMMNGKVLLPIDSAGRVLELLLILEQDKKVKHVPDLNGDVAMTVPHGDSATFVENDEAAGGVIKILHSRNCLLIQQNFVKYGHWDVNESYLTSSSKANQTEGYPTSNGTLVDKVKNIYNIYLAIAMEMR